jgi:Skp family chaperone for outer membrane proteins
MRNFYGSRPLMVALGGTALVAVAAVSIAAAELRTPPSHVAYISIQRIAAHTVAAQAAAKQIQTFRDERAKVITAKQKEVEALRLRVAQLGSVFQSSKRAKAREDEEHARTELLKLETDSQAELQKMQRDGQLELQRDLTAVITDLSNERGADLVLNQDVAVVWSRPGADWTAEAIQRINARHPEKPATTNTKP